MGLFSDIFIKPFKQTVKEIIRVERKLGIPDSLSTEQFFPNLLSPPTAPNLQVDIQSPFRLGGEVLAGQESLRKRLARKQGLKSTNITGGVRGPSDVLRPTLFTL